MDGVVEIITGRERRRRWGVQDKLRIVAETHEPGARVRDVAARHGACESLVFTWRRQVRDGVLVAPDTPVFMPVQVREVPSPAGALLSHPEPRPGATPVPPRSQAGLIEIELARRRSPGAGGCGREPSGATARAGGIARVIPLPSGARVWLAAGVTDMRRGMNGLALQVQQALQRDPHAGELYVFRGRRGDLLKVLWHDGLGMSLYAKRLERGRFIWPSPADGVISISTGQLGYLLEGIDWRHPQRTWRPEMAG